MDLSSLDFSPLWITLKTGIAATIFSFFLGIYAARFVADNKGRPAALLDGLLTLPLVLPPTVAGYILLRIFSTNRSVGRLLQSGTGIKVVHTWLGCVLAAVVISFPLMYRNARAALEQVDENVVSAARTLGLSEGEIFWRIRMPVAKPGILSGIVLTFARSLGEYGATSMLAGNIAGKTATISQKIAMVIQNGDFETAGFWCLVIAAIGLICILLLNLIAAQNKHR